MSSCVRLAFLLLLLPLVAMGEPEPSNAPPSESSGGGDVVCGPRCVQFLLKWYEKGEEDVVDLARETQWPNLEAGASLDALDAALRKREIHTYPMRISQEARLQWPYPILLHVQREDGPDGRPTLGHYVVWLPSSSPRSYDIWNGVAGVRSYPSRDLTGRLSGAVLLTSPVPINDPSEAVRHVAFSWIYSAAAVVAAAGVLLVVGRSNVVRFPFWILSRFNKERRP